MARATSDGAWKAPILKKATPAAAPASNSIAAVTIRETFTAGPVPFPDAAGGRPLRVAVSRTRPPTLVTKLGKHLDVELVGMGSAGVKVMPGGMPSAAQTSSIRARRCVHPTGRGRPVSKARTLSISAMGNPSAVVPATVAWHAGQTEAVRDTRLRRGRFPPISGACPTCCASSPTRPTRA